MAHPDDLYQQFNEVFQHKPPTRDDQSALDTANEFEGLTDDHLKVLMSYRSKRSLPEEDSNVCKKLEVMLREERNTWRLAKGLFKDQLLTDQPLINSTLETTQESDRMDDSNGLSNSHQNGHNGISQNGNDICARYSEDQLIGNFYFNDAEIRRMQLVCDWLEANEATDLDYREEEDKVEFYAEGPAAWENTFHAMRAKYTIDIPDLDITMNPNAGIELCPAMDPDAPIRTKKSLAHQDNEVEIRLFKHLFRFIRAGRLSEGQELAQRVGYHWLSSILDGWLPFSDPNLDQETSGTTAIHQPCEIRPVSGNRKRDVWKLTCFRSSKLHGLNSCEKAILGLLGGNLKSVLPVCHNWSDQLWARLRCSIDVKIERALRDPNSVPQENRNLIDFPQEFYDNFQDLHGIFKSIRDQKIVSPYKEATIHQLIQRYLILNDIDGLLNQLAEWCKTLDFDNTEGAVSPHYLRCFAHIVLFLRESDLISDEDTRGTEIIEAYIALLTQHKSIECVARYSGYLPRNNQTLSFAKLLATISQRDERRHCLEVAKECRLDVDEITQTVVELIRDEKPSNVFLAGSGTATGVQDTKTSAFDRRKIDALDYLLLLDSKNYMAILNHGNILLRYFALQKKMDAVKETFLKMPVNLNKSVENQWKVHTNSDINTSLRNNLRELDSFRAMLEAQEELSQWSEWHHKKPEEPRRPANLSKFCDNVNYEQRLKQYQQDLDVWKSLREVRTNSLTDKISQMFYFPGGWLKDLATTTSDDENNTTVQVNVTTVSTGETNHDRLEELAELRKHFVPHMITICFNVLQLTNRYEECLKVSHLIVDEEMKLYEEFNKSQLREFLDKISEVTKLIVKKSLSDQ